MGTPGEGSSRSMLELEPLDPRHAEQRLDAVRETLDELLMPFSWAREGYSRKSNREFVASQAAEKPAKTHAVVCRREGRFLGEVAVSTEGPEDDRCFLSYWIRKSEQRKGYALAACQALIQLEDRALGLYVSNSNIASRRLATRLGARAVGSILVEEGSHGWMMIYHLPS